MRVWLRGSEPQYGVFSPQGYSCEPLNRGGFPSQRYPFSMPSARGHRRTCAVPSPYLL